MSYLRWLYGSWIFRAFAALWVLQLAAFFMMTYLVGDGDLAAGVVVVMSWYPAMFLSLPWIYMLPQFGNNPYPLHQFYMVVGLTVNAAILTFLWRKIRSWRSE